MEFLYRSLLIALVCMPTIIGMEGRSPFLLSQRIENHSLRKRTNQHDLTNLAPATQPVQVLQMNKNADSTEVAEGNNDQEETSKDSLLCGLPIVAVCGWYLVTSVNFTLDRLYS